MGSSGWGDNGRGGNGRGSCEAKACLNRVQLAINILCFNCLESIDCIFLQTYFGLIHVNVMANLTV